MTNLRSVINNLGFTLMEMMTVMAILAVIAALSIPSYLQKLPDYRLESAAKALFSDFQIARMKAIRGGTEYAIVFNTDSNSYCLVNGGHNRMYDGRSHTSDDIVEKTVHLSEYGSGVGYGYGNAMKKATTGGGSFSEGDEISYADDTAEFGPDGMVYKLGYVYLSNRRYSSYAVATPTMAGVVKMKHWNGLAWK